MVHDERELVRQRERERERERETERERDRELQVFRDWVVIPRTV
jgi:hypothetical protein